MMTALLALTLVLGAFTIAFFVLMLIGLADGRRISRLRGLSAEERSGMVFLFDDETLVDATRSAHDLLSTGPRLGSDWARFTTIFEPRFPGLIEWMSDLAADGQKERQSTDGTSRLQAEWHDGVARISLSATGTFDGTRLPDQHAIAAMNQELELLRIATEHLPHPVWIVDEANGISWCNRAYMDLLDDLNGPEKDISWPPRILFPLEPGITETRLPVSAPDGDTRHWFDIQQRQIDDRRILTATPADRIVRIEAQRDEFVTTLSKTFATLPIGLAIFNRDQELATFNPALMDLTALPVDFLLSKPSLGSMLDRLREARMIPEPKDYRSWRQRVAELATTARDGTFNERWSSADGRSFRVSGSPQPDGAVALLFEDISADVSLARKFRAEIETGHAALDAMPNAVSVFSAAGILALTNKRYLQLWGDASEQTGTVGEAVQAWRTAAAPSPVWDRLESFACRTGHRHPWAAPVMLADGRPLMCRAVPLPHGFTLIDFTLANAAEDEPASESRDLGEDMLLVGTKS